MGFVMAIEQQQMWDGGAIISRSLKLLFVLKKKT
jgi:hypothetical protein